MLRDPLELCEPIAVDAAYAEVLDALDGQRSLAQVRQSLMMRGIVTVDADDLEAFVDDLAAAGLLDDDNFRARWTAVHDEFVELERRPPRRAGLLYPADPADLRAWLAPALPARPGPGAAEDRGPGYGPAPIALVGPHQPPPALAPAWRALLSQLPDPSSYERVVILATDHAPGLLPHASADKDWDTPLGPVACDLELLAKLDEALPWLLREQIRLRISDPIEWVTTLLAALWGERCPPILPLVCGQTRLTTREGAARSEELASSLTELTREANERGAILWWTAAELSHAGPAFGQPSAPAPADLERTDRDLLAPLLDGDPARLAQRCMDRPAPERPSGAAALTTLARLLPRGYRARLEAYEAASTPGQLPGLIGCPFISIWPG